MCCTLACCESVGFKFTGIKFMTLLIKRRNAASFLAWVTTILPLYFPGTVHSVPFSAYSNQSAVVLDKSRGCEASTGWVW